MGPYAARSSAKSLPRVFPDGCSYLNQCRLDGCQSILGVRRKGLSVCSLGLLVAGRFTVFPMLFWSVLRDVRRFRILNQIQTQARYRTVHHQHSMSTFTPVWLLPIVTLIVASSTGQLLTTALIEHSLRHALITLGFSAVMVIIGISLSLMILAVYIRRLFINGLPDVSAIISSFLPLGPCGQAGYSFLLAGENFQTLFPRGNGSVSGDELVGRILNVLCFSAAFVLWCMAAWWLISAVIAIIHTVATGQRLAFKLSFWGLVFPNVRPFYISSITLAE